MNVEEFAAHRAARLVDADKEIGPFVEKALAAGATDWDEVIEAASVLWLETFLKESPRSDPSRWMAVYQSELAASLAKTEKPTSPPETAQIDRVTMWVGTFTVNSGTLYGARSRGERINRWVTMDDSAVRETHRLVDGQTAPFDGTFDVGGYKLRFPGDPVGPPEIWINCRCLIAPGRIKPMSGITAAVEAEVDIEDDDLEDDPTIEDDGHYIDELVDVPFHGVLAPEGVLSGDQRMFAEGALTNRDLPLPMMYQEATSQGHDGSVRIGRIDEVWKDGNLFKYRGVFRNTPLAMEIIEGVADGSFRGVSVDIDDMELEANEETMADVLSGTAPMVFSRARVAAATIVAIPAFQEAYIALGPDFEEDLSDEQRAALAACGCADASLDDEEDLTDPHVDVFREISAEERKRLADEGKALPDGSFPIANEEDLRNAIQAIGRASDPEAAKALIKRRAKDLGKEDLIPEDWSAEVIVAGAEFVPGTHDGPGWITHPKATARIRRYWTHGKGAAKIRWGQGGDFNRCRRQLAKYVRNPEWLAGLCANMHKEALGIWPSTHAKAVKGGHSLEAISASVNLVASAFGRDEEMPDGSWFRDPELSAPTPLTITEDGRVFGHLAAWGVCHIGIPGVCTTAPHSSMNYSMFRLGVVETDTGDVPVGHITMGTGHAPIKAKVQATIEHYDNTGSVVADVAAGEDAHGIWLAGALRSSASPEQVKALKAAALSGDWREFGGNLELVAALAVNVPGFPIPRLALAASGEHQTALVASGVVEPGALVASVPTPADMAGLARAAAREVLAEQKREARLAALKPMKESIKNRRIEAARLKIKE
jgi:hypothetical protein